MKTSKSLFAVTCIFISGLALAQPSDARRAAVSEDVDQIIAQLTLDEKLRLLMMDSPKIERLGIPKYHWWNEALHGIARQGDATVFPQAIGIGATFDPDLWGRCAEAISTEARAKYNIFAARNERGIYHGLTLWSPNVNMFRDPRWGRGQETFGEDPFLSGQIGAAFVKGLQGDDPKFLKTAACAKHFAVHSGPEKLRHGFNAVVSKRDMAEYYLPAFKALVDADVESVMGAYSAINGTPCCANRWLLTDLLRGEWGFKGHIVSDVGAVKDVTTGHRFATSTAEGSKKCMDAGLDLCSEGTYHDLRTEVTNGTFDVTKMDVHLKRLLMCRAMLGNLGNVKTPWDSLGADDIGTPAHKTLALEAAEKSIVMIKNDGCLPFAPEKATHIGVFGPRAHDELALIGNYAGLSSDPVTVISGLQRVAGKATSVTVWPDMCRNLSFLVGCVGITAQEEGEEGMNGNKDGDRLQYGLAQDQIDLLKLQKKRNPRCPLIAVVFGGSPIDMKEICEVANAVLYVGYPGEQGGMAVARTIFGLNNPSGRLPITFPESWDVLPPANSYAMEGRTYRYGEKAAYPFGYGLSYTTFAYANVEVEKVGGGGEGKVKVSVAVTNTGKVTGEEVVQLYVRSPKAAGDRRVHHLEGIARVSLKPGETKTVTLTLKDAQFAQYDEEGRASVASGDYEIFVGGGQPGYATNVISIILTK